MDLNTALNDLLGRINEILTEEEYSDVLLERTFRIRDDLIQPIVAELRARLDHVKAIKAVRALFRATEEYVVYFRREPQLRKERRKRIEGLKALVRRNVLPGEDHENEIELLLDEIRQWQWKTSLDANGRLVYATAGGKQIPPPPAA